MRYTFAPCGIYAFGEPAHMYHSITATVWWRRWARVTNITPNLRQPRKYWMDIKTVPSVGLIMKKMYRELLAARRPTDGLTLGDIDRICLLCTEKNRRCNATAGSPPNTSRPNFSMSTLCIYNQTTPVPRTL